MGKRSQFALFDRTFERGLFGGIEFAVMVRVIIPDTGVQFRDMLDHHLRRWLDAIWRRVGRQLQRAIGDSSCKGFPFGRVEFPVFIYIEGSNPREELAEVLHHRRRIGMMPCAAMGLCDCEPACHQDKQRHHYDSFDVFHIQVSIDFVSPPIHSTSLGQVTRRLGHLSKIRCLPEMGGFDHEINAPDPEMDEFITLSVTRRLYYNHFIII